MLKGAKRKRAYTHKRTYLHPSPEMVENEISWPCYDLCQIFVKKNQIELDLTAL